MNFFSGTMGVEPNFISFILPYFLITLFTTLIIVFRKKLRNYKHEKTLRYAFATLMAIIELIFFWWTFTRVTDGSITKFLFDESMIPLHICALALWLMIYSAFTENQKVFKVGFFMAIMGPILTIAGGSVDFSYDRFRYWHFYQEHINTFMMANYLLFVKQMKIVKGDWIKSSIVTALIAFPIALPINIMTGSDYMYIYNYEHSPFSIIENWILALVVAVLMVLLLYWIVEKIYLWAQRKVD